MSLKRREDDWPMLTNLSEKEQERLRSVINRLLSINYLVKEKERETYMLIRRYHDQLKQFFDVLGWEIVLDDRHECVFVYTRDTGVRKHLDRDRSIWLLILRLIYQEKRQELSLSEFPLTTILEIKNKYETFRLPWVNRTTLEKYIRWCSRYHLLESIDQDIRADDCRMRLFHTWQYVIEAEQMKPMEDKIKRYTTSREVGMLDEEIEEDALD